VKIFPDLFRSILLIRIVDKPHFYDTVEFPRCSLAIMLCQQWYDRHKLLYLPLLLTKNLARASTDLARIIPPHAIRVPNHGRRFNWAAPIDRHGFRNSEANVFFISTITVLRTMYNDVQRMRFEVWNRRIL
jgi:hypothetical protein